MSAMKTFREKMAEEGLQSFIVTYRAEESTEVEHMQFWAEDAGHAGDQMDDAEQGCDVLLVETQTEYEARTGSPMPYGRTANC